MISLKKIDEHHRGKSIKHRFYFTILLFFVYPHWSALSEPSRKVPEAASNIRLNVGTPWYKDIETEWGGHLKLRGTVSWIDDETIFKPVKTGTYYDGSLEGRLNSRLFLGQWGYFDTHYEMVLFGGDAWKSAKALGQLFPRLVEDALLFIRPVSDDNRLLDLTGIIKETDDDVLYHRIDRLALSLLPRWGVVRIGRQAVTWGNGLLFNTMDLFNPFSPEDIDRDYKTGEDMAFVQVSTGNVGDLQSVYVPRRDPENGNVEWNESSLAGKVHFPYGTTEFDVMGARHFNDHVIGLGGTGYFYDAAWRIDGTWTFLDEDSDNNDYPSLVANIDYSWIWWNKNLYGFLEYFFNGLGNTDYTKAINDPDIVERIERGELFTLGRSYLGGHVRIELHPLFNVSLTTINNLDDPSGLIQPYATWDVKQNFQIVFGGNVFYGASGTEFGGFPLPESDFQRIPSDSAFLWLFYFF
jgi:hypothetical protein